MEEITQLISSLPTSIKYLIGVMFCLQILAFQHGWLWCWGRVRTVIKRNRV